MTDTVRLMLARLDGAAAAYVADDMPMSEELARDAAETIRTLQADKAMLTGQLQASRAMLAASPQGAGSSGDADTPQPDAPGWRDIATAPRDGTWFYVLVPIMTVKVSLDRPYASPVLRIIRREWTSEALSGERIGEGCWRSHHGSVADSYVARALWAPIEALPLAEAYRSFVSVPSPLPPPPSADSLGGDVAKRSEPDALPGDLRERVAAVLYENIGAAAWSGDAEVHGIPEAADAILSLIQSERGGA